MQRLEISGAVRSIYGSLGVKRLSRTVYNVERYIDITEDILLYTSTMHFKRTHN